MSFLWMAGAAAVLLWHGTAYLLARRRLMKNARPLADYAPLAQELCPRRSVRFFQADGLDGPLTLGMFRPVVLLPAGEVHPAVLRHELLHVRRWDVAWKGLLLLACAVHWFNPLVWLLSQRASLDMESSCDAAAVDGADAAERRAYGELLLRAAAAREIPFTTQFGGGKKRMKARLFDLFHPGKRSVALVVFILTACLLAGSVVAFCQRSEPDAPSFSGDAGTAQNLADSVQDGELADGTYWGIPIYTLSGFAKEGQPFIYLISFPVLQDEPSTGQTMVNTFELPLAKKLTIQKLDEEPEQVNPDQAAPFMEWPTSYLELHPNRLYILEVQVQNGKAISLRWFQVDRHSPEASAYLEAEDLWNQYNKDMDFIVWLGFLRFAMTWENDALCFTVPEDRYPEGEWSLRIEGSDGTKPIGEAVWNGEAWTPGATCTFVLTPEELDTLTDLTLTVSWEHWSKEEQIDLMYLVGQQTDDDQKIYDTPTMDTVQDASRSTT